MPDSSELAAELEFVKALALEAAGIAKKRCQSVTPHEKANLSYVTDLDQDLEQSDPPAAARSVSQTIP